MKMDSRRFWHFCLNLLFFVGLQGIDFIGHIGYIVYCDLNWGVAKR